MFSRNRNRHKASKPPEEPTVAFPFDTLPNAMGSDKMTNGAAYDLNAASKGAESAKPASEQDTPWSPEDIKEMLGFDRNDPRVTVRIIPMGKMPTFSDDGEPVMPPAFNPFDDRKFTFGSNMPDDVTVAVMEQASEIAAEVVEELVRAVAKHAPQTSPHEGYAVLLEELDELWAHVKADTGRTPEARKEAIQIAAMAIRYITDNID